MADHVLSVDELRELLDRQRHEYPNDTVLRILEGLLRVLAEHVADKSSYVHRLTPNEYEEAIVSKVNARLGPHPNYDAGIFVGKYPPQAYLMPGVTGDPHTDNANREWAIWNAYQRRLWEEEHGPVCERCGQGTNHHKSWCDSA